jgi:hypothetical protein
LDLSILYEIRSMVTIAHHIPGRIRLRLSSEVLEKAGNLDLSGVQKLNGIKGNGIKGVEINPMALSAVITYDPKKLPPRWWEEFMKSEGSAAQVINQILSDKR